MHAVEQNIELEWCPGSCQQLIRTSSPDPYKLRCTNIIVVNKFQWYVLVMGSTAGRIRRISFTDLDVAV